VSPAELSRILAVLLERGDGKAFVHDSDIYHQSPGDRVRVWRDERAQGWHVRLERENAAVDMGEAKLVETLQLPGPPA
jgi:hypothetical protein